MSIESGLMRMPGKNKIIDELKKMECEPLLPLEKKLTVWCVCWGIILLSLLVWMSYTFL